MKMQSYRARTIGFTLIEVMITVAIVAILSAIAYPSYREYIDRSKRAEAQSMLVEAAQWLERYYAENRTYIATTADLATFNTTFGVVPRGSKGTAINYTLTLDANTTRTTFTLVATRNSSGSMRSDACSNFTLTHTGVRNLKDLPSKTLDDCWK
jgi:type IV pilus assembly protein PilE